MTNSNASDSLQGISEKHIRGMIESTSGIPWAVDLSTYQFTYVGPQAEKILGYPVEKWYEHDFWLAKTHPDDRQAALDFCVEAAKKGDDYNFEYRMIHRDGHSVHILDYVNVIFDDGEPIGLQGFMFDVTKSKQLESDKQYNEIKFKALYESASDAIFLSKNTNFVDCNPRAVKMFGGSQADIISKTPASLSPERQPNGRLSSEMAFEKFQDVLAGNAQPFEWVHLRLDGTPFYSEVSLNIFELEGETFVQASVRDITSRKLVDNKLEKTLAELNAVYHASPDMVFIQSRDGRILNANNNALKRYKYSLEEMAKLGITGLSEDSQSIQKVNRYMAQALKGGTPDFEWLAKDSAGLHFPVEVRLRRLEISKTEDDNAPAVIAIVRDITERKQVENAIKNIAAGVSVQTGQPFYDQLVKNLAILFNADYAYIGLLDENDLQKVNSIACWKKDDFAKKFSYLLENTPCDAVLKGVTCSILSDAQVQYPDDHLLVEMGVDSYIGVPLFDTHNKPIGLIVVLDSKPMLDNTQNREILEIFAARAATEIERAKVFEQLVATKQKLSLHVEQTVLGVIEWDTKFRVTDWNQAATNIFGFSRIEAMGRAASDLIIPKQRYKQVNEIWRALIAKQGGIHSTNTNTTKDGKSIVCEWHNTPLVDDNGNVIGAASLVADITERVQAEKDLKLHQNQLEKLVVQRTAELTLLNQELESFSYSVSHDLRAPLRHIDGFSEALLEDFSAQLDDEAKSYLNRIRNSTARMSQLIDSLLQLSKVTNRKFNRRPVNISNITLDILNTKKEHDPHRNVNINVQPNLIAVADHRLVNILIENLISNAWKYTSKNEITDIEIGVIDEDAEEVYFVRDNGAGFDMAYKDKLFKPFQRMHTSKEFEGTGIGLATVQRIINRHGGQVWGESIPGKHTTFYFTLDEKKCDAWFDAST